MLSFYVIIKISFDKFQNKEFISKKGRDWYTVTEQIECVCDGPKSKLEYQPENIDGIYVQNIYQYLEFLKGSKREKDKQRIGLVEEYIKSQYEDKER